MTVSEQEVPQIPKRLTDPRPVLAIGTLLWAIATAVVWASGDLWMDARPTCLMGMALGGVGYLMFTVQRRSARLGKKGAQQGLIDVDKGL
ncbi:DUF2530 domain-containing protein [Smaragdicoccus niigatensis]